MYTKLKEEIEKSILNSEDKQKMLESLKNEDHEYMSFFVCRNPVEKLLSIFEMKGEHFLFHQGKGRLGEQRKFFTWPEILSFWSAENWRYKQYIFFNQ